jgi:phage terminase large subunit-like protein
MTDPDMSEGPDPRQLAKLARRTMSAMEWRQKFRRIDFLGASFWYRTQLDFFAAGCTGIHQRLIYGGNQTGKTLCCAAEVVWHATGAYPSWWTGWRPKKKGGLRIWASGESVALVRDSIQRHLCGFPEIGTGLIPAESFHGKVIMVPGGTGAVDTVFVQHVDEDGNPDGISSISFKSFEQRRERLQSETVDLVWIDERCSSEIYAEFLARTSATNGHLLVSFTPVGAGAAGGVTYRFLSEPSPDRRAFRIPGDEARHISADRRAELAGEYSEAERETRLEGHPQLGSGPVFPIELLGGLIKEFDKETMVPDDARHTVGIDFGFNHPFAAVWIAWTAQYLWVIDSFRVDRLTPMYHVQRIHNMTGGLRIPIAWPHDGHVHSPNNGIALIQEYKQNGANVLPSHAVNHGTTNYSVDPALEEIRAMMYAGTLIINPANRELLDELRNYHRDEDYRVVKQMDDLVSAFRYAVMMRRSGKPREQCRGIGFGNLPYAHQNATRDPKNRFARGSANHPGGSFDPFTGRMP